MTVRDDEALQPATLVTVTVNVVVVLIGVVIVCVVSPVDQL